MYTLEDAKMNEKVNAKSNELENPFDNALVYAVNLERNRQAIVQGDPLPARIRSIKSRLIRFWLTEKD